MHFTAATLIAGVVLSSIGAGFFMYGKRAGRPVHLICGALLAIFPWFVTNLLALILLGIVLVAAPFLAAWWFAI